MRSSRGFTLVETLIGLLILTMIVTTSLAVFFERQRRLKEADDTIVAWQALANEAEVQRQTPYSSFSTAGTRPFVTDTAILSSLRKSSTSITVKQPKPNQKTVKMTVTWNDGARHADLSITRVALPGDSFW